MEAFDAAAFRAALASSLGAGLTPREIVLTVTAASLRVVATIRTTNATLADAVHTELTRISQSSPQQLSASLGVEASCLLTFNIPHAFPMCYLSSLMHIHAALHILSTSLGVVVGLADMLCTQSATCMHVPCVTHELRHACIPMCAPACMRTQVSASGSVSEVMRHAVDAPWDTSKLQNDSGGDCGDSLPVAVLAGVALGSALLLALMVGGCCCWLRCYNNRRATQLLNTYGSQGVHMSSSPSAPKQRYPNATTPVRDGGYGVNAYL